VAAGPALTPDTASISAWAQSAERFVVDDDDLLTLDQLGSRLGDEGAASADCAASDRFALTAMCYHRLLPWVPTRA
jgi:hypothetical protein